MHYYMIHERIGTEVTSLRAPNPWNAGGWASFDGLGMLELGASGFKDLIVGTKNFRAQTVQS